MKAKIQEQFKKLYGEGASLFASPGRVNLIGEHIDYNGGFVLQAALPIGNYLLIRENGSDLVRLAADDLIGTLVEARRAELD